MIIKGKSRAGPSQLARHLGRADTNERVEILQLDSAGTTEQAFRDWQTYTLATNGKLGLYHANIDPDAKYDMTRDQWWRAVEVLEEELGLQGQPRAVVLHEKNGREHIHVVWARTDMGTMKLRGDGWNYDAHERASLRLEQEFGHEHVPGKHAKRDREKQPEFPKAEVSHDEWQQSERGGIGHVQRRAQVKALFEASDTGLAFKAALEDAGYVLARGDRRGFVILDDDAKVYSLSHQLPGVRAKDLRAFMVEIDLDNLPSVKDARALLRDTARPEPNRDPNESESSQSEPPAPPTDATSPEDTEADRQRIDTLRAAILERHRVELKEQELRHAREVTELQANQQAAADKAIESFSKEQARRTIAERPQEPGGFDRLWRSIRDALLAELEGAIGTSDIADLRHVRTAEEKRAAEEIANRERCEDFDQFKPLFEQVQRELEQGIRQSREFELKAEIRPGAWFIVGGQKAYVADMEEIFTNAQGRTDARLRVIFDNGTESNMLMRSLQRALHKDEAGRRITDPEAGPLFVRDDRSPFSGDSDDTDLASGTIYVLRSKSDHPIVAANRDVLHKIGVTGGDVASRRARRCQSPKQATSPTSTPAAPLRPTAAMWWRRSWHGWTKQRQCRSGAPMSPRAAKASCSKEGNRAQGAAFPFRPKPRNPSRELRRSRPLI